MWNVIIKGNTDAKLAETDGYQWMTNPSKIATGDAKQILDQKFNHFNNQLIFLEIFSVTAQWPALCNICIVRDTSRKFRLFSGK